MKTLSILFFLFSSLLLSAQEFKYPVIPSHGNSIIDFIPDNWSLLDSVSGMLNDDKLDDLAFVLQLKDSMTLIPGKNKTDTLINPPRILAIAFYNGRTEQYELAAQSNSFIISKENYSQDEPFEGMKILNDVLEISFREWYSMGSWSSSRSTYKFRYQDNAFTLIGADNFDYDRSNGKSENRSYNFSTKKVNIEVSNNSDSQEKSKSTLRHFVIDKLKTLQTFTAPYTWEVEPGYTL